MGQIFKLVIDMKNMKMETLYVIDVMHKKIGCTIE